MELCCSLDDFFFTLSNNIHHTPGNLSDQLLRRVMFDAANAVEDDHLRDVAADQVRPAMDHVRSE